MAALFALGVMSVAWMVVVALLALVTAVLLLLAVGVAAAPDQVPGLTIPSGGMGASIP